MTRHVHLRDVAAADEAPWRALWAGYLTFYQADLSPAVTAHTFARLLDPASPVKGRVAEREGVLLGFSTIVLHEDSWALTPACYLGDLFVAPEARGLGVGRALIEDLVMRGKQEGWSQIHWLTRHDNPARRLYDTFATADDFVHYALQL